MTHYWGVIMIQLKGEQRLTLNKTFNLIGKIDALIYVRVSTTDQAEKGYSLDSQVELCKERALTKFGFKEEALIVIIEEGKMGDDPNRPALNYVLYLLERGLGKKLIMLHPDRFTRDNTLQGVISRKVWSLGVDIEFIEFEVDPSNAESMLMYNIQGSIAQYNKAKILANSRRGRVQKARKGELPSFRRLYGYKYDKSTKTLEVNVDEEVIYLKIVDMLLNQNISCNQIARQLSLEAIPAPGGGIWYQTTVTRILRNESYTGNYYYGKTQVEQINGKKKQVARPKEEWIKINIPALIDQETYLLIQAKIDGLILAKGRKSTSYLLKGIVRCGRCGASAGSGVTSKVKSGVYKYYACRNKSAKGYEVGSGDKVKQCQGVNWRVDIVDDIVWNWLYEVIKRPERIIRDITEELNDRHQIESLEGQKTTINKKIIALDQEETNYAHLYGKQKITEEQFDQLIAPLRSRKAAFKEELRVTLSLLTTIKGEFNEAEMIATNMAQYQKILNDILTMKDKRAMLQIFIEKVILHEDFTIEIFTRWGNDTSHTDIHRSTSTNPPIN